MKILVACEESQTVCIEFRKLGHEAFSCDIQPCSGGHPKWHIQGDVIPLLKEKWGEKNHHPLTWFSIIGEKYGEMCKAFNQYYLVGDAETSDFNHFEDMQREAIQVAASCVAMLECIDRQAEKGLAP